jgi:hypothetical protein
MTDLWGNCPAERRLWSAILGGSAGWPGEQVAEQVAFYFHTSR